MNHNLHQTFKNIKKIEPNPKLEVLILSKIEILKEKQAKKRLVWSYFGLTSSFGAFTLAILGYGNAFLKSDFWDLLKLISTDTGLVLGNWGDFAFSLLETFPVVSLAIILIPIFAMLISFSVYFKSIHRSHYNYI
jgi:hypothetical protein